MCTKLGLPHVLAFGLSHYIYSQHLDPMRIHLLCCGNGGEKITSHNVVWDAFAFITKNIGFHGACEWTHIILPLTIQSSCWQINIMLSVDGIHMLTNVIIDDFTQVDLVSCVTLCQGWLRWWHFKQRKNFIEINMLQICLSLSSLKTLGAYIKKLTFFFIVVLTWHELQRALQALLFWFCVHFIGKQC